MTLLAAAAGTLVARRGVLLAATAVGTAMQGLAIQVLAVPAKVRSQWQLGSPRSAQYVPRLCAAPCAYLPVAAAGRVTGQEYFAGGHAASCRARRGCRRCTMSR